MIRTFLRNERGAYAMMTAILMVPIMGGLAVAIDFSEMSRQRQVTLNALDAAGIAAARRIAQGATDEEVIQYATDFFEANLGPIDPDKTVLDIVLPTTEGGGGTLKLSAELKYDPYFAPSFRTLLDGPGGGPTQFTFDAKSEIRLKNTLEVALVLDNSGSMDYLGSGSGQKRLALLKDAAKQLVDTIAGEAELMKQVDKPVQFGIVPFASAVNIGSANASASWMDTTGISPIHHENFDWSTMSSTTYPNKYAEKVGSVWYARGADWGDLKDKPLTRFSIYNKMQRVTSKTWNSRHHCVSYRSDGVTCRDSGWVGGYDYTYGAVASWSGCVEARPHPYNVNDAAATTATPATMFVPMFAPDETDNEDGYERPANNNWRKDATSSSTGDAARQRYMPKYFDPGTSVSSAYGSDEGPNISCTTKAITPLTDVTEETGLAAVKAAIDGMQANGATNVPEGMAWGWRVVSGGAPFTEGRPDTETGNDKVVIVLTDGANTYYPPGSVMAQHYSGDHPERGGNDLAGSKAVYSSYGYLKPYNSGYTYGRLFLGTDVSKSDFSFENYTKALNEHFDDLCANAKAPGSKIIVMTVALDLSTTKTDEKAQIDALKACASESRYSKDAEGNPEKLFWNATGGTLSEVFQKIADELSNLRIVG